MEFGVRNNPWEDGLLDKPYYCELWPDAVSDKAPCARYAFACQNVSKRIGNVFQSSAIGNGSIHALPHEPVVAPGLSEKMATDALW